MRALAVFLVLAVAPALTAAPTLQRVSGDDHAKLVGLDSPAISPDGRHAALVVRRTVWDEDRRTSELDAVDLADGRVQSLYQGTGISGPAYSPDGTKLAFIADEAAGKERYAQLFVMPSGGGAPAAVTRDKADVASFAWRPDSRGLAYAAPDPQPVRTGADRFRDSFIFTTQPIVERNPPRSVHLFTVFLDNGRVTQLTFGAPSVTDGDSPSWSPDGRTLAIALSPNAIGNDQSYSRIVLVNVADKSIRSLTSHTMWASGPLFSPDGSHVAYACSDGDPQVNPTQLYVTTPRGGNGTAVSGRLDRSIGDYVWANDSQSLVATAPDRVTNGLYRITLDGAVDRLEVGNIVPGVPLTTTGGAESPSLANALAQDGTLVFLGSATSQPLELFKYSSRGGAAKVTGFNDAMQQFEWSSAERISFPTTLAITGDGVLYLPPDFSATKKYPLVVYIHGGPDDPSMMEFDFWAQVMAARGWLVLRPNYRGSPNLGLRYQRAILYDPEDGPGKDIVAAIDALRSRGIVDSSRIAVCGWSYGGIMTAWLISKYHFWRVAVSGASVNDWIADYGTADDSLADVDLLHGSPFVGNEAAEWRKVSPVWYARNVTTPVLILSDVGDNRDPFATSSMYWRALRDNHKDATLRVWPIDGHFPADPVRIVDVYRYWIDYIAEHFN